MYIMDSMTTITTNRGTSTINTQGLIFKRVSSKLPKNETITINLGTGVVKTADIPTNTSGAEVPAAMSVSPITRSPTPKCLAMTDALSTNLFAPQTRIVIPASSRIIFIVNSMTVF